MTMVRIPIRANLAACDPALPESYDMPHEIRSLTYRGLNWAWNGRNIYLLRVESEKTIADHLFAIAALRRRKMLRSVQAGELSQIARHIDLWDEDWKTISRGGRIFFGGTVYDLVYKNKVIQVIWCAWFDHDANDWFVDCVPITSMLRPDDSFACVPSSPDAHIPGNSDVKKMAFPRRRKCGARHQGKQYPVEYTFM